MARGGAKGGKGEVMPGNSTVGVVLMAACVFAFALLGRQTTGLLVAGRLARVKIPPPQGSRLAGMQLGDDQVGAALETLDSISAAEGRPPRLLMFSLGNDSPLWYEEVVTKRGGDIAFIENNPDWWNDVVGKHPQLRDVSHMVTYSTKIEDVLPWFAPPAEGGDWGRDRWCTDFPIKDLPEAVVDGTWDVVFVDAPWGFKHEHPGRFQSVFEAARLVSKEGGRVLLDDCNRESENKAAQALLGVKPQFLKTIGRRGQINDGEFPGRKEHLKPGVNPTKVMHYSNKDRSTNMVCVFDFNGSVVPPAVETCGAHVKETNSD